MVSSGNRCRTNPFCCRRHHKPLANIAFLFYKRGVFFFLPTAPSSIRRCPSLSENQPIQNDLIRTIDERNAAVGSKSFFIVLTVPRVPAPAGREKSRRPLPRPGSDAVEVEEPREILPPRKRTTPSWPEVHQGPDWQRAAAAAILSRTRLDIGISAAV